MVATARLQITFSAPCWSTNGWAQCLPNAKLRELLYVPQRDSVKLNLISRMCCAKRIVEVVVALGSDFPKWLLPW